MVGRCGSSGERFSLVIAIARTRPGVISGCAEGMLLNEKSTSPLASAVIDGALPLYGICVMSTPILIFKSSPARCWELPLPDEEKLSLPGFFFATAMNSLTVFAGYDGWTSRRFGLVAKTAIGAKSLTGS